MKIKIIDWKVIDWENKRDEYLKEFVIARDKKLAEGLLLMAVEMNKMITRPLTIKKTLAGIASS